MYFKGLFAALAALSLAGAARGNTISAYWDGSGTGYHLKIQYDDDGAGPGSAGQATAPVGMYYWQPGAGSSNPAPFNSMFQTFCIDIDQKALTNSSFAIKALELAPQGNIPGAAGSGPSSTFMSAQQADYIRELWGENYASLLIGTVTEQNIKCAAFQLALWEILFEHGSTKNLSNGYLKVVYSGSTPSYVALANQFLASTYDVGYSSLERRLVALTSQYGQDHVTVLVPLPPAALGGLALVGAVVAAKTRARRRCAAE